MRVFARSLLLSLPLLIVACGQDRGSGQAGASDPAIEEVRSFVAAAEAELAVHWEYANRVFWIQANFINDDTNWLASRVGAESNELLVRLADGARRYADLELPDELARKLELLRTLVTLPAPSTHGAAVELAELRTGLETAYATGRFDHRGASLDLRALERIIDSSRTPEELAEVWAGWRTVAVPMAANYARMVDIANAGARELGFPNVADLWLAGYEMSAAEMQSEAERLWLQVAPLYEQLHCHVRDRLNAFYGDAVQPREGPIRADLLGNMWAQQWLNIHDIVALDDRGAAFDLSTILLERGVTPRAMTETGEAFFVSLGFEPLPETFWARSLFEQPRDRDVVCHPSAWSIDAADDLRIKMCMTVNAEDFQLIHHELGHNFYQRAYAGLDFLFRDGAHDGFHEAIGDFIALSVTPEYLRRIGLIDAVPPADADLDLLLQQALDKIAFLPFAMLLDQWRWRVFRGDIGPEDYNRAWWELRERYQGIVPPVARPADAFDPGAKYHIPASVPYLRYFLAFIMQFQFHEAACSIAGWDGALHRCSIYGNREVGRRLHDMLELGRSVPWPDALEAFAGTRSMDASSIIRYFAPLMARLETENAGRQCGW
jgi:peptidyl-dipeptidase A